MAGHPLRPATRQSLGRPLPHQQADRPRAHPPPPKLSTSHHAAASKYPVLATLSDSYPEVRGRSLTCYSPVRRSSTPKRAFPLDLHVLSTPPAFVLSQDQTLHRKLDKKTTLTKQRSTSKQSPESLFVNSKKPTTPTPQKGQDGRRFNIQTNSSTNTLLSSQKSDAQQTVLSRGGSGATCKNLPAHAQGVKSDPASSSGSPASPMGPA